MRCHSVGPQCKPPRPPPPKIAQIHISHGDMPKLLAVQSKVSPRWSFSSPLSKETPINGPSSTWCQTIDHRSPLGSNTHKNMMQRTEQAATTNRLSPPPIHPKPQNFSVSAKLRLKPKSSPYGGGPVQPQHTDSRGGPPSITLADLQAHLRNFFGESRPP
ncbi:hypothetical protein FBUS_05836 [Fasciolopsis buskii]|uniref:Uncharacterized protein n=1 Tax=Fasciolopsis buskii TaxID=27845 RepID=A0A8E0RVD4_9TREM|nr:hypothetical protein FBUS_05836 [Fasciolopsis buski]